MMWANMVKAGATMLWTNKFFEIRTIKLRHYVAPHNVRRCFHNENCDAHVHILQWNNCIYIAALCVEISTLNNKS